MAKILLLIHLVILLGTTMADHRISNYITTKRLDISLWHELFPSRYFEVERKTIESALMTVQTLASEMSSTLSSVAPFKPQKLDLADLLMQGSDAESCVENIVHFVEDVIDDELITYLECTADAESGLLRLHTKWTSAREAYLNTYKKTLLEIDLCGLDYSHTDSFDWVKSCVESANNKYFAVANKTRSVLASSSSMNYFRQTVVKCASAAAENVASSYWEVLGMVLECSSKTGILDPEEYADKLAKPKSFDNTLLNQINKAQEHSAANVGLDELIMEKYYCLQKEVTEKQSFESGRRDFHLEKSYQLLNDHYDKVSDIALENPGNSRCVYTAKIAMDIAASNEATNLLVCDITGIENTTALIVELAKDLLDLSEKLPSIGDAALLSCFSRGHIFVPGTIELCSKLINSEFNILNTEHRSRVSLYISLLQFYADNLEGYDIPCLKSARERLLFEGDTAVYNLQRCIHTNSDYSYAYKTAQVF